MSLKKKMALVVMLASATAFGTTVAEEVGDGNRYDRDRVYNAEISSAEGYLGMIQNKLVIIDVRRLREYAAGHPKRAYNVPYPHIYNGDQTAENFYWEVYRTVRGRVDTPIMTLCRTGSRSITAANILADPENLAEDPERDPVPGGIPFTDVRNNWDGFVGRERYAFIDGVPDPDIPLDLNNNGVIDESTADFPDTNPDTKDTNADLDGWRNFQGLPFTSKVRRSLSYLQDPSLYEEFQPADEPWNRGRRKHGSHR